MAPLPEPPPALVEQSSEHLVLALNGFFTSGIHARCVAPNGCLFELFADHRSMYNQEVEK
jgi:hypothetical protein